MTHIWAEREEDHADSGNNPTEILKIKLIKKNQHLVLKIRYNWKDNQLFRSWYWEMLPEHGIVLSEEKKKRIVKGYGNITKKIQYIFNRLFKIRE